MTIARNYLVRPSTRLACPQVRTVFSASLKQAQWDPNGAVTLPEIYTVLAKHRAETQPRDLVRSPNQLHFNIDERGRAYLQELLPESQRVLGREAERYYFTDHGMKQWAQECLRGKTNTLKDLQFITDMGDAGKKVAILSANLHKMGLTRPIQLRTVLRKDFDQEVRTIRAKFLDYTEFDNLEFVGTLMSNPMMLDMVCVSAHITEHAMRLRLIQRSEGPLELNKPVPAVEAWNSPVGLRAVGLGAGAFFIKCLNGLTSWRRDMTHTWRHTGSIDRIREKIPQALTGIEVKQSGLLAQYEEALHTVIDNTFQFLDEQMKILGAGEGTTDRVKNILHNEPTVSSRNTLAGAVDAVTYAAHKRVAEGRLIEANELEGLALSLMERGLSQAENGRIPLRVTPAEA